MEIHLFTIKIECYQCVEPGEKQGIGYPDFSSCDIYRNHAVAEDIFGVTDSLNQFHHPFQFTPQDRIKSVGPMANRTDRLKIILGDLGQIEVYHSGTSFLQTAEIDLRLGSGGNTGLGTHNLFFFLALGFDLFEDIYSIGQSHDQGFDQTFIAEFA